jgi:hypothetical protein
MVNKFMNHAIDGYEFWLKFEKAQEIKKRMGQAKVIVRIF